MSERAVVVSGTTAETIADVEISIARYRDAAAKVNATFATALRQSEAALETSRVLLDRIERRSPTTFRSFIAHPAPVTAGGAFTSAMGPHVDWFSSAVAVLLAKEAAGSNPVGAST